MREYLLERDGKYELHKGGIVPDSAIEVPDGAEFAVYSGGQIEFRKQKSFWNGVFWIKGSWVINDYPRSGWHVIWSRFTQPEELPFASLNDQYAEIEKVRQTLNERQKQYGSFEDVAMTTQKIMDAIAWARGSDKLPAPHHEALHMIASKIARIVNGDYNHQDSWHDIQGYAKLIEDLIG